MHIGEAIALVALIVTASAFTGVVTSRLTAHWLNFNVRDIDGATIIGAVLGLASSFILWGPILDRYRYEDFTVGGLYLALLTGLSIFLCGSSVAFVMLVSSMVHALLKRVIAAIDRMFAKSN